MKNFSTIINDKDIITVEYQKNNSVLFSESQILTDDQKSQARSNIGAGTSDFDGTWDSLSGKPNVVQSTGQSTSDVMSQKAVTDELNKKANRSGDTFTGDVIISSGKSLKTDTIKSADGTKWIAEITAAGLEIGAQGTPLRLYSSTRPIHANANKELAYTSDIPTNYVTTDTTQTISGAKTFVSDIYISQTSGQNAGITWQSASDNTNRGIFRHHDDGKTETFVAQSGGFLFRPLNNNNTKSIKVDPAAGALYPEQNSGADLGKTAQRWNAVYAGNTGVRSTGNIICDSKVISYSAVESNNEVPNFNGILKDDLYTTTPTETRGAQYLARDKNGAYIGGLRVYHDTNGTIQAQLMCRSQNTEKQKNVALVASKDSTGAAGDWRFVPNGNAVIDLGASGQRWAKTYTKRLNLSSSIAVNDAGNVVPDDSNGISFAGTKSTTSMIRFANNDANTYGNGIVIGGGGVVIMGCGESADALYSALVKNQINAGKTAAAANTEVAQSENTYITSDNHIRLLSNCNDIAKRKELGFNASGQLVYTPTAGGTAYAYTLPTESGKLATTGDIKNGTLTIQKNGTNVATFTANQSTNATANITVPAQVAYGTCATAAATAAKEVTVSDTTWALTPGTIVGVKFTNTNTASNVTINVNGTGAKNIWYNNAKQTGNSNLYAGYANRLIYYMYDGTYWCWLNAGAENDTIPSAMSWTGGGTKGKTATCHNYSLLAKSYTQVIMISSNTAKSALTLNINGKGAKPIYINGAVSSATNYTLPAGSYFVYYDGTNYYFRTDGKFTVGSGLAMTTGGTSYTYALPKANGTMMVGSLSGTVLTISL